MYVHLHNHTEFSQLDGLSSCEEAVACAVADGNPAMAITDHGVCSGHPAFQKACDAAGIKPIFGMEGYFVPDRRSKDTYSHLVLLAIDDAGLKDLWAASTEAFVSGHYNKPRVDWELLQRYGSRWFATSACLGGPVSKHLLEGRYTEAGRMLLQFKEVFGDRFYLEIQSNSLPEQIRLNQLLAQAGEALKIPLVAASDAHFPTAAEHDLHKLWMACQTSPANEDYWHYIHIHTEAETRKALLSHGLDHSVVDAAIRNTVLIAEQCTARISGHAEPPVFARGGTHEDDSRALLEMCRSAWGKVPANADEKIYLDRLEYEHQLVAAKRMSGCYLMVHDVTSWTRAQGRLVGPGRGSAAGSLMSWLLGITSMDPIPARLMFERFLTPGRDALPDFDMDFASSWRGPVTDYMVRRYGDDHVIRVGTHMRYRNKGIFNKLFSIFGDRSRLPPEWQPDSRRIASVIDEAESHTAGLGLPFEEAVAVPELTEMQAKYSLVFDAASQLVGRLNSYGRHPAGLVVSTDASLATSWPMRAKDGGPLISQWDYRAMEELGLFKLDFLTLRTLDSVQDAIDLVGRRAGVKLDPFAWTDEHHDPQVWGEIGTGHTAGMFQVETSLGAAYCGRSKPPDMHALADLVAYMRPGPRNSGMTESYLHRRAGQEEVSYPHPLLEEALRPTFGLMIYQEDVISAVSLLGGYSGSEADGIRRILGKKQKGKVEAAGREFVSRCVERGHDEAQVATLWEAMGEFAKYGFNRAHAYAYATLAYWTAWLKTHYPVETFAAILSTLDDMDRMAFYATDARRLGVRILPPDVNFCGAGFAIEGLAIRYGLSSIHGVGPAAVRSITASQPYTSYDDFLSRAGVDTGVLRALAKAGALDSLVPSRKALVRKLEADQDGSSIQCTHKDLTVKGPNGLPCTFDWSSEPVPVRIGKTGNPLTSRPKPIPKTCRVSCRQYSPPAQHGLDGPEYRPDELFRLDQDTYGCWMSDAVFAQIDSSLGDGMRDRAREIALALPTAPQGRYPLLGVNAGVRQATTRKGTPMWWLTLATEVSYLSMAVFPPRNGGPNLHDKLSYMKQGTLIGLAVVKDRYHQAGKGWRTSYRLDSVYPLGG